jgi:hypothetical protein
LGSATVSSFPSVSPARIAVIGRQNACGTWLEAADDRVGGTTDHRHEAQASTTSSRWSTTNLR